jgi:hypothetical protein
MAKTEAGYWLAVEPVDVEPVSDAIQLAKLLERAIRRGNPVVPTPTRADFPPDVMRKYCGLKSFSGFERTAECCRSVFEMSAMWFTHGGEATNTADGRRMSPKRDLLICVSA